MTVPSCPKCGYDMEIREMQCQFHHERGLKREAVCWSCGACYGVENWDVDAREFDRHPLPWNANSVEART